MNKDVPLDQIQDSEVSTSELEAVIDTNKELFDQLNAIPEIEALDAIAIEEERHEKDQETPSALFEFFNSDKGEKYINQYMHPSKKNNIKIQAHGY